jgi:ABC-2 type transport system permease protein
MFKKKLLLVLAILLVEIIAFAYGENNTYKKTIENYTKSQSTNYNWNPFISQEIQNLRNRLKYSNLKASDKKSIQIQIDQYNYDLQNNISPLGTTAAKFTGTIMEQSVIMLLPLLIIIFAGDSVSGEFSARTIKVLLTRAVPRWKILLSKFIAIIITSAIVVIETAFISLIVSKITFHNWGLMEPLATGFKVVGGKIDTSNIIEIYQWQYLLLVYSLGFFIAIVIASISFTISILVKNTAASISVMMAALIGGSILQVFIDDWPFAKYFFSVNLRLPQYLTGSFKAVDGMNLTFSMTVLLVWAIVALIVGFYTFYKQDVLV